MSRAQARDKRKPNDAYFTPDNVALQCLRATPYAFGLNAPTPDSVIEPSVGGGAFARAARQVWPNAVVQGFDIDPAAPGQQHCNAFAPCDWLTTPAGQIGAIVGNPPYRDAEAHVRHALAFKPRFCGFLLRLGFLESVKRARFWQEHPPAEVHVLCKRPSFTGGGTDSAAYGWFVWRRYTTPGRKASRLGWIWPE